MALVMGTMSLVVAMSVESTLVTQFLSSSLTFRSDVVYLDLISFAELQIAPSTLAMLLQKQHCQCSSRCWMVFQSLAPIQEISVIGTGSTFYFDMSLDLRRIMPSQVIIFGGCKDAVLAFASLPIPLSNPMSVLFGCLRIAHDHSCC